MKPDSTNAGGNVSYKKMVKDFLRPWVDASRVIRGTAYDLWRYLRNNGYVRSSKPPARSYKIAKIYHALEKSMSFRKRRKGAGRAQVEELYTRLTSIDPDLTPLNHHERVAIGVLAKFAESDPDVVRDVFERDQFLHKYGKYMHGEHGFVLRSADELGRGELPNPAVFFSSRRSVRDYSETVVERTVIKKSVQFAMSSPSTCNRQPWKVRYLDTRSEIDQALRYQNGNRGFGHEVNGLLIVSMDRSAYDNAAERYQHWIDGGMFSMSLVWALHSLGVASCCLNWSTLPARDRAAREALSIPKAEEIIMMVALGYPREVIKLCASSRRPVDEVLIDNGTKGAC